MESERRKVEVGFAGRAAGIAARMLFPHFCVGCEGEGKVLCTACRTTVSARMRGVFCCPGCGETSPFGGRCHRRGCADGALDGVVSVASYVDPMLRGLLHLYKYEGVEEAGVALAELFALFWRARLPLLREIAGDAAVIAVPMHPVRECLRGFNQTVHFAEAIAQMLDGALTAPVRRRFAWRTQVQTRSDGERAVNATGTFVMSRRASVPRQCIVIDDVLTTGATLHECARVLKRGGAERVWGVTLLRG